MRCPKHPGVWLYENTIETEGWCPRCQTWYDLVSRENIIEGYQTQIKHLREHIEVLEKAIRTLQEGPK
jgi:transcription initiation factor IIE alpha subunit